MKIAKHIKAFLAAILKGADSADSQADPIQHSIVVLNKHGKPDRVPLASLKRSPPVKKTKTFTGTVVLNGKRR